MKPLPRAGFTFPRYRGSGPPLTKGDVMADDTESLHDPDTFVYPLNLWFLETTAPPDGPRDPAARLLNLAVERDGKKGTVVAAFTDFDLAERYATAVKALGRGEFRPVSAKTPEDMQLLAAGMLALGETHLILDPEPDRVRRDRLITIVRYIADLRNPRA